MRKKRAQKFEVEKTESQESITVTPRQMFDEMNLPRAQQAYSQLGVHKKPFSMTSKGNLMQTSGSGVRQDDTKGKETSFNSHEISSNIICTNSNSIEEEDEEYKGDFEV